MAGFLEWVKTSPVRVLLRLGETQNALQLPVFFFFSCDSSNFTRNIGEFGAKNYFIDHRAVNDKKDIFLVYSFLKQVAAKGNSLVAT